MHRGSNDNPTVAAFLKNTASLGVQGSVALKPVRGNCRRGKENRDIDVDDTPLPKHRHICAERKCTKNHTTELFFMNIDIHVHDIVKLKL